MKRHSLFAASLSAVLLAYAGQAAAEAESILSQVQRQQEELERYYASLKPVLTADTVLAGIAMPKGTTLTLPNRDRLSTELWTQHKYFLGADFSRPVVWQGVPIASIDRELSFPEVFVNAPPPQSPPKGVCASRFHRHLNLDLKHRKLAQMGLKNINNVAAALALNARQ